MIIFILVIKLPLYILHLYQYFRLTRTFVDSRYWHKNNFALSFGRFLSLFLNDNINVNQLNEYYFP